MNVAQVPPAPHRRTAVGVALLLVIAGAALTVLAAVGEARFEQIAVGLALVAAGALVGLLG